MIFIKVNLEEGDKKTQLNQINDETARCDTNSSRRCCAAGAAAPSARPNLAARATVSRPASRTQWEKYRPGGRDERAGKTLEGVDPTMPIRRTFEENLVPCLSPEAALRSDVMREDRCYLEPVDIVLSRGARENARRDLPQLLDAQPPHAAEEGQVRHRGVARAAQGVEGDVRRSHAPRGDPGVRVVADARARRPDESIHRRNAHANRLLRSRVSHRGLHVRDSHRGPGGDWRVVAHRVLREDPGER